VIEREDFIGNGLQAIDAKGRVGLPADLRGQMERNNGARSLFIDLHEDEDCLVAFDRGFVRMRREQMDSDEAFERQNGRAFDRAMARRTPFASAEPVPFDASGRFILPPFFREAVALGEFAFFTGAMDFIEIWNPLRMLDSPRAASKAKRLVAWHLKQKGLA
jgi:MraZ protein